MISDVFFTAVGSWYYAIDIKEFCFVKIILASASPRRRELLSQGGLEFLVIPSQVEEHMEGDTPQQVVMSLSLIHI